LIRHKRLATIPCVADRFDEILTVMREERDEWTARMERRLDQTDENLRFVGELNRRSEIVMQDLLRASAAMRAEIRESIRETRARTERIEADTKEALAESKRNAEASKAHTRAIFALIDRIEGGNGGLAPAG
jgi:hypothetical protein